MADNQKWLEIIRAQVCPDHSAAADYWDSLTPEWRGVVIHSAALCGSEPLNASMAGYTWAELYARIGVRGITQLRRGIQHLRNVGQGFGSLRRQDFTPNTANRKPPREAARTTLTTEMVIAPHILSALAAKEKLEGTRND